MIVYGASPDLVAVLDRLLCGGRVDDQPNLADFYVVQHIGTAVEDLVHPHHRQTGPPQILRCAVRGDYGQPGIIELPGRHRRRRLVLILDRDEDHALHRQGVVRRELRLEEGQAQIVVYAHDLSRGPHLRAQQDIRAGQLVKWQEHLLDRDIGHPRLPGIVLLGQGFADHDIGRNLGQGQAHGLGDKGYGPAGAGIGFQDIDRAVLVGHLEVDDSDHIQAQSDLPHIVPYHFQNHAGQCLGRYHAGAVTRMDARLLDVLHDRPDQDILAVAHRIHIYLHCILEEVVYEHGMLPGDPHRLPHVDLQPGLVVDDLHGPSSQDIGGPHQDRIADLCRHRLGFGWGVGYSRLGLGDVQLIHEGIEPLPVLGQIDAVRAGAQDPGPQAPPGDLLLQGYGQVDRRLASKLNQHPIGLLLLDDVHHIF